MTETPADARRDRRLRGSSCIRAACLLSALLALAACRALPTTRYYLLELPSTPAVAAAAAAPRDATSELRIGVAEVVVAAPYDQERIAYRPAGRVQEIGFYHYHRWSAPPSQLAQAALVEALDRLPGLAAEPERAGTAYDLVLRSSLQRLVEIDSPTGISASVELRWTTAAPTGASGSRGEAMVDEPVNTADVDAVVAAFAAAFERAAGEIGRALLAPP